MVFQADTRARAFCEGRSEAACREEPRVCRFHRKRCVPKPKFCAGRPYGQCDADFCYWQQPRGCRDQPAFMLTETDECRKRLSFDKCEDERCEWRGPCQPVPGHEPTRRQERCQDIAYEKWCRAPRCVWAGEQRVQPPFCHARPPPKEDAPSRPPELPRLRLPGFPRPKRAKSPPAVGETPAATAADYEAMLAWVAEAQRAHPAAAVAAHHHWLRPGQ
jgi:hypothetical protein